MTALVSHLMYCHIFINIINLHRCLIQECQIGERGQNSRIDVNIHPHSTGPVTQSMLTALDTKTSVKGKGLNLFKQWSMIQGKYMYTVAFLSWNIFANVIFLSKNIIPTWLSCILRHINRFPSPVMLRLVTWFQHDCRSAWPPNTCNGQCEELFLCFINRSQYTYAHLQHWISILKCIQRPEWT